MFNNRIFVALFISILATLTFAQIGRYILDVTYTPGRASLSIAESKDLRLFISQPSLESNSIQSYTVIYKIDEVWIEKAISVDYFIFFFRQVTLRRYRLVIKTSAIDSKHPITVPIQRTVNSPKIICNGHIVLDNTSSDGYFYGEFNGILPNSIKCLMQPDAGT